MGQSMICMSRSANRNPGKGRQGCGACPLHDRCAVILNCSPAYLQIGGDVLAGMSCKNKVHDLPLTRRQIAFLLWRGLIDRVGFRRQQQDHDDAGGYPVTRRMRQ